MKRTIFQTHMTAVFAGTLLLALLAALHAVEPNLPALAGVVPISITNMRAEGVAQPLGVEDAVPRFSWRYEATPQVPMSGPEMIVDLPAESLTQIIFTKDDLAQMKELKLEEKTFTPGTAQKLGLLETTRLRALGKLGDRWLDLTDLNIVWTSSAPDLVPLYQGGLVQRLRQTTNEVTLTAKTLAGVATASLIVPPNPAK
jgi:hypothetical protein